MVRRSSIPALFVVFSLVVIPASVLAHQSPASQSATSPAAPKAPATTATSPVAKAASTNASSNAHGIYLVFPFQNAGASARLDWLSEGLEELTIQGLSAAGEQVYSHSGRLAELERYGLPASAKLSRATMLHVAEDLDADFVVFGSFNSDGKNLTIDCRLLRVNPASLLRPLREAGSLDTLMDIHTRLTWRMLSANDRAYPLNLAEFKTKRRAIRLDAFEHYIRGLVATDDEVRLRELREATRLEPDWPEAGFALAETYFTRRDCNSALPWYAKVPKTQESYTEAVFSTGVCRLLLNQPDRAEEAFATVQSQMRTKTTSGVDFPEVLNNLAISKARQEKTSAAQEDLKRASSLDPDEDDYPFNLGLIAMRQADFNVAIARFREASEREPDIPEDRALLIAALEKAGKKEEAEQERNSATEAFGPNGLPNTRLDAHGETFTRVERVKTELDPETLRFEMESAQAMTPAESDSGARELPTAHLRRARQEMSIGNLDGAEREYRAALLQDKSNPTAHMGLGEIARRQGRLEEGVKEFQASLLARDSAMVRTMLAHVYLEQHKVAAAREEAEHALKLAPNYAEAKQLLEHLPGGKTGESRPKGVTP